MGVNVIAQVGQLSDRAVVDADDNVAVSAGLERLRFSIECRTGQNAENDDAVIDGKIALRRHLRGYAGAVDGQPGVLRRYAGAQIGQNGLNTVNRQR